MTKIYNKMGLSSLIIAVVLQLSAVFSSPAIAEGEMRDSATVLMYHRFGESRYPSTNISVEQFEAHLAHLTAGNYTVLRLDDIIARLRAGELLPDRTVAITIDDAYQSVYNEAWPRLTEAGFPFTLFVASSPIDRELSAYMSWDQIRELQASGVAIGSQTHTHPHLHRLTDEQVRAELSTSNSRFIEEIGLRPELFAYPYGELSGFVVDAVKDAGFIAAFGQNSGIMHSADDQFQLPRFAFNEAYGTIERLKLAVDGLPLKVSDLTPKDMVLETNPPLYGFTVSDEMSPVSQLRCFSNKHGKLDVTMLGMRAEIRAPGPLSEPRARINCTMPAVDERWRWFGRQFLTR